MSPLQIFDYIIIATTVIGTNALYDLAIAPISESIKVKIRRRRLIRGVNKK